MARTRTSTERAKARDVRVLGIIHDFPGLNGVDLARVYPPVKGRLLALQELGMIVWRDGWYLKSEAPK